MVKIDITTDIKRPVDEVYTYVVDLRNAPQWQSWLQSVDQHGPTRIGTKAHQTGQWMGRKMPQVLIHCQLALPLHAVDNFQGARWRDPR